MIPLHPIVGFGYSTDKLRSADLLGRFNRLVSADYLLTLEMSSSDTVDFCKSD